MNKDYDIYIVDKCLKCGAVYKILVKEYPMGIQVGLCRFCPFCACKTIYFTGEMENENGKM